MSSHREAQALISPPPAAGSTAGDLLSAILRADAFGWSTRDVLAAAAATGVDPLDYCAHRCTIPEADVLARAARWAGLDFAATVPELAPGAGPQRIDALASVRVLRAETSRGARFYLAPNFEEVVALRTRLQQRPELADELCIVPRPEIRRALTCCCGALLIDESRQRLARRWPFATASLDLDSRLRAGLVAGLATTTAATLLAPFALREVLLPATALLLGVPAAIRLWAVGHGPAEPPAVRLPSDAELPSYSVLVPLRNEAAMVPQLACALAALDYPVLGSSHT